MTLIRSCCNYAVSRKNNVHPVQKLKFVCPDPVAWASGSRTHVMCGLTSRQLIFEARHWNNLWHVNDRYIAGKCCFAEKFSWVQGTFLVVAVHFFFFFPWWRVCVSIFMKCFEAVDFVLGQKVMKAYTSAPLSSCFSVCILSSCKLFLKKNACQVCVSMEMLLTASYWPQKIHLWCLLWREGHVANAPLPLSGMQ